VQHASFAKLADEVVTFKLLYFAGYFTLLTSQVISQEFSRCYDDVNICLWTNGSLLRQSAAESACRQRNNSFLARVTDNRIQNKLAVFRNDARSLLRTSGFWIGVHAVGISSLHWLDGSPFVGLFFVYTISVGYTTVASPTPISVS